MRKHRHNWKKGHGRRWCLLCGHRKPSRRYVHIFKGFNYTLRGLALYYEVRRA